VIFGLIVAPGFTVIVRVIVAPRVGFIVITYFVICVLDEDDFGTVIDMLTVVFDTATATFWASEAAGGFEIVT
jgi:hypothetical protein